MNPKPCPVTFYRWSGDRPVDPNSDHLARCIHDAGHDGPCEPGVFAPPQNYATDSVSRPTSAPK